nr:hypothetical protein [Streptomyces sp. NK15101]
MTTAKDMLATYPADLGNIDKACGDECASHADMHEHCRLCAEACRAREAACNELMAALG